MFTKNETIKSTMKVTRERHAGMLCRVFEVKVTANKLSRQKKDLINQLFREAKWLRNSELAKGDIKAMNRNAKAATVKVGEKFEAKELTLLGSQIRQDIVDGIKSEAKGLKTKKSKGEQIGRLKFKSVCNCIPLRQYGTTYHIDFESDTISIQGMGKYPLKVRGLHFSNREILQPGLKVLDRRNTAVAPFQRGEGLVLSNTDGGDDSETCYYDPWLHKEAILSCSLLCNQPLCSQT